jgi:hypothetical protein
LATFIFETAGSVALLSAFGPVSLEVEGKRVSKIDGVTIAATFLAFFLFSLITSSSAGLFFAAVDKLVALSSFLPPPFLLLSFSFTVLSSFLLLFRRGILNPLGTEEVDEEVSFEPEANPEADIVDNFCFCCPSGGHVRFLAVAHLAFSTVSSLLVRLTFG